MAPTLTGQNRARSEKIILGLLIVVAVFLGVRALRIYNGVVEGERLFVVADQQMDRNQYPQALTTLDHILALNPLYYPAYDAKTFIYLDVYHDSQKALQTLKTGLAFLPHDMRLHRALGQYYLQVARDYRKAHTELSLVYQHDPEDYVARNLLREADESLAPPGRTSSTRAVHAL